MLTGVLGAEHPDTLLCQANLSVTLRTEGRFEEAQELATAVLAGLERVLGKNHPDIVQLRAGQRLNCDLEPQNY
jgi:alkylhydroperoxidase family enzyme